MRYRITTKPEGRRQIFVDPLDPAFAPEENKRKKMFFDGTEEEATAFIQAKSAEGGHRCSWSFHEEGEDADVTPDPS